MIRSLVAMSLFLFASLLAFQVPAAELGGVHDSRQPIEITADRLEALQQQRQTVFFGHVMARQGDLTLYADKLTVFFQAQQNQIEKLEASGSVRVEQLDRQATASRATYMQTDETLTLIGDAVVQQGQNRISGDEIILYLQENRTTIKSTGGGRVKAILNPESAK